jgi:Leucine-rich repeat (LRR) protein
MKNVKTLSLKSNYIKGKVVIENYPHLRELNMSDNKITKVSFINAPVLSEIKMN